MTLPEMTLPRGRSPWIAVDPGVDPIRLARLLSKAHEFALSRDRTPAILRPIVAGSWRRAADQGIDPDGYAPAMLTPEQTVRALAENPASHLLPMVKKMLSEATNDAEYFAVLSDGNGVLLWLDGHAKAMEIAVDPGFLPGHLCSEAAVGTNAIGTALALDHAVQIFSAEHFNRRLHGLTCAAAPIRDTETGDTIGVLNLSGSFRTNHPHSLPLVTAVAQVVEGTLTRELEGRAEELRARYIELLATRLRGRSALVTATGRVLAASPRGWLGSRVSIGADGRPLLPAGTEIAHEPLDAQGEAFLVRTSRRLSPQPLLHITIEPLGRDRAQISIGDWHTELSPRHSQLVVLLAIHPAGLSAEQLRQLAYRSRASRVTVRAEVSRLRRVLGPALSANPYRLAARVDADCDALRHLLHPADTRLG
jgi:hypothetical protein